MRPSFSPTLHLKLARASTVTVSDTFWTCRACALADTLTDWAYLEDWCRRLTGNFADVYVFTVPLYLPKLDNDGKWRVVSTTLSRL